LCVFQRNVGETERSAYTGRRRSKSERQRDSKMDPQEEIIQKPNPRQIIIIKLHTYRPEKYTKDARNSTQI
jgi:hypothetical protein